MEGVSNNQVTVLMACPDVPFSNSTSFTGRLVNNSYSWSLHPVLRQSIRSPIPGCLLLSPSQAHWILFLLPQRPMSLSAFYTHYKNYQNIWLEFVLVTNGCIPLLLFRECWEKTWDSWVTGRTLLLVSQEVWVWRVWSPYPVPQATWRAQVVARTYGWLLYWGGSMSLGRCCFITSGKQAYFLSQRGTSHFPSSLLSANTILSNVPGKEWPET